MKPSKITLKWKMFAILASFILLALIMIWIFQLVFLDDLYRATKINNVKNAAITLEKNINNEKFDILAKRLSYDADITVRVIDKDANILNSHDAKFNTISSFSQATLLEKYNLAIAAGGSLLYTKDYSGFMDDSYHDNDFVGAVPNVDSDYATSIIYIKIIQNSVGSEFGVILDSTITPINSAVNATVMQLIIISAGVLILALIVSFILAKAISSPIELLTLSARELAKGTADVAFDGSGYKEIEELNSALNYASKQISEVEHLRKELIANVSHDLRTPLTLIKGYSELMCDIPSERSVENLKIIADESERLSNLVTDMLDINKLQDGDQKLSLSQYDIVACVGGIVNRLQHMVQVQSFTIKFTKNADKIIVIADEIKIAQVIYNLLSNAINYIGEDNIIEVDIQAIGNMVKIAVIDHGEGIDVDMVPHIWDRYYKSDKNHKRATIGTGLGLSIVKGIMTRHPSGVYGVETAKGQGSKFYIALPVAKIEN